jgi:hypothetical protein
MTIPSQQHRKIVKPGDDTLQLDSIDQENSDRGLVLTDGV